MSGCQTCGGFGNRHDPIAHGVEPAEEYGVHDCPDRIDHPLMLTCPCGYLSRTARQIIAEGLRAEAAELRELALRSDGTKWNPHRVWTWLSDRADAIERDARANGQG